MVEALCMLSSAASTRAEQARVLQAAYYISTAFLCEEIHFYLVVACFRRTSIDVSP